MTIILIIIIIILMWAGHRCKQSEDNLIEQRYRILNALNAELLKDKVLIMNATVFKGFSHQVKLNYRDGLVDRFQFVQRVK